MKPAAAGLVAVDPECWRALKLTEQTIRHYARMAERRAAGGLLVFNPAHAFYVAHRDLFDGCAGPAPTDAAVAAVRAMEPVAPQAVPVDQWPWWAKLVAKRRRDGEAGVGSTFERLAAGVGGKRFESWAERRGVNCGCKARRGKWNRQYAYGITAG